MAVATSAVIDEVLEKLRQSATSPVAVTRVQVLREVNNMPRDLTEHSYVFIKKSSNAFTLVNGTRSYSLPVDCFEPLRVFDEDEKKIYPITEQQLEEKSRDWLDDEGYLS